MSKFADGQHGGIINSGTMKTGGGNVVGGDLSIDTITSNNTQIRAALQPIAEAMKSVPPALRPAAEATFSSLRQEVEKGSGGGVTDDSIISGLLKVLAGLVPSAVSTVVSAFANPVLGAIAGPVTEKVLRELGQN